MIPTLKRRSPDYRAGKYNRLRALKILITSGNRSRISKDYEEIND